jgi:hypothetical protein
MRIEDTHIAISVFVCVDEEVNPGQWTRMPNATAFLTTIKGDPFWIGYVVTAAHVIEGAGNRRLYLRVNTDDGFDDIAIEREEWFIHDRADVAAVRVKWTGEKPYNLYSIYPEQFVRADYSLQMPTPPATELSGVSKGPSLIGKPVIKVGIGDQISMVGLFVEQYGRSKSLPIVRTGTIARMPSAPVRFRHPGGTESEQFAYLAEIHSHGGLSGSPVYVHRRVTALTQIDVPLVTQPGQPSIGKIWVQDPEAEVKNFLGLVSGHFDITQAAETTGDIDGTITVAINAGIAVITPAEAVRELLWRDDVLEDRLQDIEAAKKARAEGSPYLPKERVIYHYKAS